MEHADSSPLEGYKTHHFNPSPEASLGKVITVRIAQRLYRLDLSKFKHPGGPSVLAALDGKDVTLEFLLFHRMEEPSISAFEGVSLVDGEDVVIPPVSEDLVHMYKEARKNVKDYWAGSARYYVAKMAIVLGLFALSVVALQSNLFGSAVVSALALALSINQGAFIVHDAMHSGVRKGWDKPLGFILGNCYAGVSHMWWKWSHDIHHVHTNAADMDLDITHLPFFALSLDSLDFPQAKNWFSRLMVNYQHLSYWPIMVFARFNLNIQSIWFCFKTRAWGELACIPVHFFMLACYLLTLNSMRERVLFLIFFYVMSAVLHIQITLSHWALPKHTDPGSRTTLHFQIEGSQNIRSYWWNRWFYGGLNYQLEHHLFPRVKREHLKKMRDLTGAICTHKELGLQYQEIGFFEAIAQLYNHLKDIADNTGKIIDFN